MKLHSPSPASLCSHKAPSLSYRLMHPSVNLADPFRIWQHSPLTIPFIPTTLWFTSMQTVPVCPKVCHHCEITVAMPEAHAPLLRHSATPPRQLPHYNMRYIKSWACAGVTASFILNNLRFRSMEFQRSMTLEHSCKPLVPKEGSKGRQGFMKTFQWVWSKLRNDWIPLLSSLEVTSAQECIQTAILLIYLPMQIDCNIFSIKRATNRVYLEACVYENVL